MHADDSCLMAPSAIALQKMLNLCYEFSQSNDIIFNPIKSQWYGNSLFDTTYKYTHLNILHN